MSSNHHKLLGKHFYGRLPYISHLRARLSRLVAKWEIFPPRGEKRKNTKTLHISIKKVWKAALGSIKLRCSQLWIGIVQRAFLFPASPPSDEKGRRKFFYVKIKLGQHFGVNRLSAIRLEFYHEALLGVYWTPHNPKSGMDARKSSCSPGFLSEQQPKQWMQNVSRNLFFFARSKLKIRSSLSQWKFRLLNL